MKNMKLVLALLFLTGAIWASATLGWAQQIISKVVVNGKTNYCHIKYPAIREETLFWDRPVLKDASSGDVIDFYGRCDHDPLGREEILAQRAQWRNELNDKANQD